jgi:hypothetical protein
MLTDGVERVSSNLRLVPIGGERLSRPAVTDRCDAIGSRVGDEP